MSLIFHENAIAQTNLSNNFPYLVSSRCVELHFPIFSASVAPGYISHRFQNCCLDQHLKETSLGKSGLYFKVTVENKVSLWRTAGKGCLAQGACTLLFRRMHVPYFKAPKSTMKYNMVFFYSLFSFSLSHSNWQYFFFSRDNHTVQKVYTWGSPSCTAGTSK